MNGKEKGNRVLSFEVLVKVVDMVVGIVSLIPIIICYLICRNFSPAAKTSCKLHSVTETG